MKKTLSLMLLLFCMASTAMAQRSKGTLSVIPRLGVNVSQVHHGGYYYQASETLMGVNENKAAAGLTIGADAEYQLTELFYLSAGLDYSLQRSKFDNCLAYEREDADTRYLTGISSNKMKLGYIHLPVMVGCYVYNTLSVKLGLQFGYALSGRWSYDERDISVDKNTGRSTQTDALHRSASMTSSLKRFEVGIPVGVAYEYQNVLLDLRYFHGLTKAFNVDCKNRSLTLTVGYRFDVAKF